MSKLPIPVEVVDFQFLIDDTFPTHAVLEFVISTNPVRVFLTQGQLDHLAAKARLTSDKLSGPPTLGC
jgi:hypothetical protein